MGVVEVASGIYLTFIINIDLPEGLSIPAIIVGLIYMGLSVNGCGSKYSRSGMTCYVFTICFLFVSELIAVISIFSACK